MKSTQRLGYQRLAEELIDRGLVPPEAIRDFIQQGSAGGQPFPLGVVQANYVTDWELSRLVCELYNLPFITAEMASPTPTALEGLDPFFLLRHQLVPLCRQGRVLTVLMPGMVQAEVLAQLASDSGLAVIAAVGTVRTNAAWLTENLSGITERPLEFEEDWGAIFDEADAAVQHDLGPGELEAAAALELNDPDKPLELSQPGAALELEDPGGILELGDADPSPSGDDGAEQAA